MHSPHGSVHKHIIQKPNTRPLYNGLVDRYNGTLDRYCRKVGRNSEIVDLYNKILDR